MSKSRSSGRGNTDHLELIPYRPERSWPVQLLLLFWRWAVELALVVTVSVMVVKVHHVTGWPVRISIAVVALFGLWLYGVLFVISATRTLVPGVFWCLVTRHRLRTFFLQGRVFNRSARLPWIVFTRPTVVGERVWVWLVPGLSIEDFENSIEKLAAACWARTVRVERSRRVGALIRVDVVRRDPLMATDSVASVLIPATRRGESRVEQAGAAGPLGMPRTVIDLTNPTGDGKAPAWGTPAAKKTGVNKPVSKAKAALSSQDGAVIPSNPSVVTRGGEDVSDYV